MQDFNPDWPYINDDERYAYPLYKKHPFCYICCNRLSCRPSEYSPSRDAYSKPNAGRISRTQPVRKMIFTPSLFLDGAPCTGSSCLTLKRDATGYPGSLRITIRVALSRSVE
ncbi:hypothetical protein BO83DRAFT_384863 [Aspergillus eucalypticola CBS 122712]|uniref:Uncharacterized protein n=1 Tax=Aspergillus eucalypticola (strain CBS 122712 / IBT 29274) TaxID=1448314 RepID=A0A317WD43_ASPEC|nr:uncharacterized protein BO83DRAFT_384863 [Aspergillus eucalypticola CBS 122712]PWY84446.1 hypothetical protein BO83DRAFT_384863 [Aspergillus eucalypticola CBS 122712]